MGMNLYSNIMKTLIFHFMHWNESLTWITSIVSQALQMQGQVHETNETL